MVGWFMPWSYQDGYKLVTVHTYGDPTRPPTPSPDFPCRYIIPILSQPVLAFS